MDVLQSFASWLYQSDASPFAHLSGETQFIVLGIIGALLLYAILIFRPAPGLGEPTGPQNDQDGRGGTPHWSVRTIADRTARVALPLLKALILVVAAVVWGRMLMAHPGFPGTGLPREPLFVAYAGFITWIVAARFWAMGRKARMTVLDSDEGTVGLNFWWVSELGLQESARLRVGGLFGQGESGVFWVNPALKRNEIALPLALRERLRAEEGTERKFTLGSSEGGAGPWPVLVALPLAYAVMSTPGDGLATASIEPAATQCTPKVVETEKIIEKVVEKPVPQIVDREICTVYFDFDKSALTPAARKAIATVDGKSHEPGVHVTVIGHTDTVGTPGYNQTLSEERAASAAKALEAEGIPVTTTEGRGENDLAVSTPDDTREMRNRRTVITIDPPVLADNIPTQ